MSNNNDINHSKLVGGKRKNGHKYNCECHICENMKNKAKRGGYEEEFEKKKEYIMGGPKKKNGHRKACKCPICKNMKNSKKRGETKSSRRTRKKRGGGNDTDSDTDSSDDEYDEDEHHEYEDEEDEESQDKKGGRKKKRSNGHKANCKCPICKNMRKKKGGDKENQMGDIENQMGDIEEAGIKATSDPNLEANEIKATTNDYDALDAAEKGEAGQNIVGGTRKKRRGGKRRKSKRSHRRR